MNIDQLSDFLLELTTAASNLPQNVADKREEAEIFKKFLNKSSSNTMFTANYIASNYTDVDLIQSLIGQILSLFYKGGVLRLYSLQYIPGFVSLYLLALSKKHQKSVALFETFFVAIYNEEIVVDSESNVKKVEEVRIPSIKYPSIYHDPTKLQANPEIATIRPTTAVASNLATVRMGPYPTYPKITAENKFVILTRVLRSVTQSIFVLSSDVVSRHMCLASLSITKSGFSFPETGFRNQVLETEQSQELIEDFSRKPRQQVSGGFLLELLTGCYLALFNGCADLALRAIDAIHLRGQYEMLPDVLLVVNSIRNSLLDNPLSKEKRGELMWTRPQHKELSKRKDMVTNASLRMKRMPEDIPIQEQAKEKEHSRLGELVEEGMDHLHDLRKKVVGIGLHHKSHKRRKSVDHEEQELQPIKEERTSTMEGTSEQSNSGAQSPPIGVIGANGGGKEAKEGKMLVLNGEEIDRRLKDLTVIEHDYQKELDNKNPPVPSSPSTKNSDNGQQQQQQHSNGSGDNGKGSFSIGGLRHMDSGSSTYRSIDNN